MAQINVIKITKNDTVNAPKAIDLISFRDAVARVLLLGPAMLATMNQAFDDSNPQSINWTTFEAIFGIPAGKGQTVFDMVNGTMGAVNGTMQNSQAANIAAVIV